MRQEWDDYDRIIAASKKELQAGEEYNQRLMAKVHGSQLPNESRIAAVSLIMAGIMLFFVQISDVKAKIMTIEGQVRSGVVTIKQDFKAGNFFMERDINGE